MKTIEELKQILIETPDFNLLTTEEQSDWYSVKVFNKLHKDIKYLLLTNYIHDVLLQEELTRTGLYQWILVHHGEVKLPRDVDDYNDYDIIQINMSAQDLHLIGEVRNAIGENSKTKIVLNNDYTTEAWGLSFDFMPTVFREMQYADMMFGTEYYQTTAMSEISGRRCYVIPHPCDVKRLKSLTPLPKKDNISVIWRRYDQNSYIPSLMVRNQGLTTQLIGYDKTIDKKPFMTTTLYDYVLKGTNFMDFCDQMRESKIILDPFTFHSYSRATVDTAAMGIPVVGSNRTHSVNVCYPLTKIDPWDVKGARDLITRLQNDDEFYNEVVKIAKEKSEFYNHQNSKERYFKALYETVCGEKDDNEKIKKKNTRTDKVVNGDL